MTETKINYTRTTIQISQVTKDRLEKLGIKGDTYNDILCRLLDKLARGKRVKK